MLYLQDHNTCYKGLNPPTIDRLKMEKDKYDIDGGNFCRILEDGQRVSYIPTTQRVNTVLFYHRELRHMLRSNLYEIIKLHV